MLQPSGLPTHLPHRRSIRSQVLTDFGQNGISPVYLLESQSMTSTCFAASHHQNPLKNQHLRHAKPRGMRCAVFSAALPGTLSGWSHVLKTFIKAVSGEKTNDAKCG